MVLFKFFVEEGMQQAASTVHCAVFTAFSLFDSLFSEKKHAIAGVQNRDIFITGNLLISTVDCSLTHKNNSCEDPNTPSRRVQHPREHSLAPFTMIQLTKSSSDSSLHSTVTAQDGKQVDMTARRVCFDEKRNEYFAATESSHKIKNPFRSNSKKNQNIWYTGAELQEFKAAFQNYTEQLQSEPTRAKFSKALKGLYEMAREPKAFTAEQQDERIAKLFRSPQDIELFMGMERLVSEKCLACFALDRTQSLDAVDDIQSELQSGLCSSEQMEEEIADSLAAISETSVRFAQLLARAQLGVC